MTIQVLKPGALSTLQDLGRVGYQRFGVVVGGAMDPWSHRMANLLVGNDEDEATLEITLMGPSLRLDANMLIAICGADLAPRIGDAAVPMGRPVLVRAGSQIDFGRRQTGARSYMAVRGGYQVARVMDSKSTYVRGAFGGFDGRALRKGDEIATAADAHDGYAKLERALRQGTAPFATVAAALVKPHADSALQIVRVTAGQQWDAFTEEAQTQFVEGTFHIGTQSDRMGYRMEGQTLKLRAPLEMISEAVAFGTIQVPPDGDAIVLMADRQTTGGYPKIATVISVDLPLLAQMMPHQALGFTLVTLDDAQELYLAREQAAAGVRLTIERIRKEG